MAFINTLLLFACLHVQSYCSDFCSCPSCACSSCSHVTVVRAEPVRNAAWSYPIQGMIIGLFVSLLIYYKISYNKKLASHEKLGLIRSVIHKTRTPLTLIRCLLEELSMESLSESAVHKLKQALAHTGHLEESFQNVQVFGDMDVANLPRSRVMEYELYAYISSIVEYGKVYADIRRVRLELHKTDGYARCCMDKTSVTVVLEHLLKKMIDDTPSGGRIDIFISRHPDSWNLRFVNGPHEARGNNSHLLRLVPAYPIGYYWGSLSIMRKVIRHHGGKLITSKCGKTTAFEVSMPTEGNGELQKSLPLAAGAVEKDQAVLGLSSVLLIMADKELSDFLCDRLAGDFSVTLLTGFEEAFSFCSRHAPDAIIVDETVNGAEGGKFCSRLKSDVLLADIPVVLLVNPGDDEKYLVSIGCGAEKVEPRTVNVCRLKAELRVLMGQHLFRRGRIEKFLTDHASAILQGIDKKKNDEIQFIEKVQGFLEKNLLKDEYSVVMLNADMGMSRTAFYNKIKDITGESPQTYMEHFKMDKAKALLVTQRYNVTEVAAMLGFCDAKYFSRRFARYFDVPPSYYLRSITG